MNHTHYDKQAQQIENWEDKRAEEFNMTMKIIVTLLFCSGWIYLMKSIADWLMAL